MTTGDDEIRKALLDRGDEGKLPRHTLFFFFGGDVPGLEQAALAERYSARRMTDRSGLILERTLAVDEVNFGPVSELMERWASQFACEYDGWECELLGEG